MLSNSKARIFLDNFDPAEGFIESKNQMLIMTYELKRSANVGIGYAFSV
ncbi:hypothetical protein [Okeania sp.]|nr:hypothetical protein [Okeania sp.]MEB3342827.1 hypothetical protein [Okeania sp.]